MSVAVYVEGASDKPVLKKVIELMRISQIPVRAGHGEYQGSALLSRWREVAQVAHEEKLIFCFDQNKATDVQAELQRRNTPVSGKRVVFLVAPWMGIETFVESHLDGDASSEYIDHRSRGGSKKTLAEQFAERLSSTLVRSNPWITGTLVPALRCDCPPGTTIA